MDFEKYWSEALKNTEIIRSRVQALLTMSDTHVPYILLSESSINVGDTIVRKGEVVVQKPSIIIPQSNPQLEGFEFDKNGDFNENSLVNFLLIRGISLPSMHYDNKTNSLDIFEGKLSKAVKHYNDILQQKENVQTGLLVGPEDYWQFSILIFVCSQIVRNTDMDILDFLKRHKKKRNET